MKKIKVLKDIGEFGLIDLIRRKVRREVKYPVLVGIGDDAFAADLRKGRSLVVTKDMLIENIHFKNAWATPFEIGYKSIAVNLSDLAAMGAVKPLYCLVGLGVPGGTSVDYVDKLYTGMLSACKKYSLAIVGGDTVSTRKDIVISITLLGEADRRNIIKRSCAKPGDILLVSGPFGDSGAGLFLMEKGSKRPSSEEKYLIRKHLLPEPRLKEAEKLSKSGKITSLIDSSDGLAASIKFITQESRSGAKVSLENIPISAQLKKMCKKYGNMDPYNFALNGGEEYELVYTAKPKDFKFIKRLVPSVRSIGLITSIKGIDYYLYGKKKEFKKNGFEHFR